MSEHTSENHRKFIAALAKLVSPMDAPDAAKAMLGMLPGLQHLPAALFEQPGELAVEIACEWDRVPSYARLRKALEARQAKIADKGRKYFTVPLELEQADMSSEERSTVIVWLKHEAANDLPRKEMVMRLSTIRRYSPAGYRWLIEKNLLAAEIAVTQRWSEAEHRWTPPTDAESEQVSATVGKIFHRAGGPAFAPGGVAPIASGPDATTQAAVLAPAQAPPPPRPAGALTPEQMHAVRMNNPLLRPLAERQAALDAQAAATPPPQSPESSPAEAAEVVEFPSPGARKRKSGALFVWQEPC